MYEDQLKKIKSNIKKMKQTLPPGTSFQAAFKQEVFNDAFPQYDENNKNTNEVIYKVFETSSVTGVTYTDQTGWFPYRSSRGNEHLMVTYHYDANIILIQPIQNRQAVTSIAAWKLLTIGW